MCLWAQLDLPQVPVAPLALEGDVSASLFEHPVQPLLGTCTVLRAALPLFSPGFRTAEDKEWWVCLCQAQRVSTVPRIGLLHRRGRRERTTNAALLCGASSGAASAETARNVAGPPASWAGSGSARAGAR